MSRPGNDPRDSLRSGRTWRSVLRTMAAVATIRLALRFGLIAIVALVLGFMVWQGG